MFVEVIVGKLPCIGFENMRGGGFPVGYSPASRFGISIESGFGLGSSETEVPLISQAPSGGMVGN